MINLNRHFFREDKQLVNKHMKRCSALLVLREMHIKTTVSYHSAPARKIIMKKTWDVKKLGRPMFLVVTQSGCTGLKNNLMVPQNGKHGVM